MNPGRMDCSKVIRELFGREAKGFMFNNPGPPERRVSVNCLASVS